MPVGSELRARWDRFFYRGFSGGSLGALRIAFGAGLFLFHFTQFDMVFRYDLGGAHYYYLDPIWYFQLLGISHDVPVLTTALFALLLLATLSFTAGLWTRTSALVVLGCIFYLKGARDSVAGDVHHRYLMPVHLLFFLLLSKCGWVYSLDERLRRRRGAARRRVEEWEASWPIKVSQLFVASFYFWGAIAKLRVSGQDWIAGGLRLQELLLKRALVWGVSDSGEPLGNPVAYLLAQHPALCLALGIATLCFELGFPLVLCVRRERWRLVFLAGVSFFHLAVGVIAYVGFVLIPFVFFCFFDLDRAWRRWRGRFPERPPPARAPAPL